MHMRLLAGGMDAEVVLARAEINYRLPVINTIRARCAIEEKDFGSFREQLLEKGKARIEVSVEVKEEEKLQASMLASVAVKLKPG